MQNGRSEIEDTEKMYLTPLGLSVQARNGEGVFDIS